MPIANTVKRKGNQIVYIKMLALDSQNDVEF